MSTMMKQVWELCIFTHTILHLCNCYFYPECSQLLPVHLCLGFCGSSLSGPPWPLCWVWVQWGWRWLRHYRAPAGVHWVTRASFRMEMWFSVDFLTCIICRQQNSRTSLSSHVLNLVLGKTSLRMFLNVQTFGCSCDDSTHVFILHSLQTLYVFCKV